MTRWRRKVVEAWAHLLQARAEWALRRAGALVERHAALTVRAREIRMADEDERVGAGSGGVTPAAGARGVDAQALRSVPRAPVRGAAIGGVVGGEGAELQLVGRPRGASRPVVRDDGQDPAA